MTLKLFFKTIENIWKVQTRYLCISFHTSYWIPASIETLYQIAYLLLDISTSTILQKVLILMNGIGELLHHTRTEQRCLTSCNVNCNTCFLIVKFLFVILFYVILGLVSIGIYIVLFVDVLIFVALVLIRLPGIGGEKNKCFMSGQIAFYSR